MHRTRSFPIKQCFNLAALVVFCLTVLAACCSSDAGPTIPSSNPLPPVASILAQPSTEVDSLLVSFDASESYDVDGTIVSYDWDFTTNGSYDETTNGAAIEFTYPEAGTYRCTVRVTDDDGLTDTASILVTVPVATSPPTAMGEASIDSENPMLVQFDATSSFDTDGTIVRYDWDFDHDGNFDVIDGGPTPDFTFPSNGSYTVTVRVFDNDGLSDTADIEVVLTGGQSTTLIPPEAALTPTPESGVAPLGVEWDASASTDSDGVIVRYDWDMDADGVFDIMDGGATVEESYLYGGDYTVIVRVFDDDGGMDAATATVYVNEAPVALATSDPPAGDLAALQAEMKMTGQGSLTVTYDGSSSFDNDGEVVQYDWDLDNDGEFEIIDGSITQQVTYDASGMWVVALRVTDNEGATDTASADTDINEPPTAQLQPDPPSGSLALSQQEIWELPVVWHAETSFDPDGEVVQFDWDMDNDGIFELINQANMQNAVYTAGGLYTVNVRVIDNDGASEIASNTVDVNEPPLADVTANPSSGNLTLEPGAETPTLEVLFDASGSTDSDGTIVRYDWDMNNDAVFEIEDGGATQSEVFTDSGFHIVAVKVHDDDGATDIGAASVDVNEPPTVVLTADYMGLPEAKGTSAQAQMYWVEWDASNSFDADGTVVQYDWDTDNDGSFDVIDGGSTQSEMFMGLGTYTMGVRITDNDGATAEDWTPFEIEGIPPTAVLSGTQNEEILDRINWNASGSFDPDGGIVEYEWDFDNDGTYDDTTSVPFASHDYGEYGPQTCTVRVTDNDGLQDTATTTVTLYAYPVAVLTGTFGYELVAPYRPYVVWDASGSYDPDGGTIDQYNWDMDANLIFEIIDGGVTWTEFYDWSDEGAEAWVEVIDDEGMEGYDYAWVEFGLAAPIAILKGYEGEGSDHVYWDASDSFDIDGTIVLYEWDVDNDGTYDDTSTSPFYYEAYQTPVPHTCTVRVTDDSGLTDTDTYTFTGDSPPWADIWGSVTDWGEVMVEVTWNASNSFDPDGTIVQYEWDFNFDGIYDLTTTTQSIVTYNYMDEQQMALCRVRVTDDDGMTDTEWDMVYFEQPE